MSTNIARANKNAELVRASIAKSEHEDMREGDLYIDKKGVYHKIVSLKLEKQRDWKATEDKWREKHGAGKYFDGTKIPTKDIVMVDDVKVTYVSMEEDDEWSHEHTLLLHHQSYGETKSWVKVKDQEKYERLAAEVIADKNKAPNVDELDLDQDSGTSLIHVSSKEYLTTLQSAAREKAEHFMLVKHHVMRSLEKQKAHYHAILSRFEGVVAAFQKEVKRIQKIITIIELYLGIHETILQIQEGPLASEDAPITFRQRILFMDEEVGDPRLDKYGNDEGLDFRNIEAFDSWLCDNQNYKKVIPEEKCVCVFKVRRKEKHGHNVGGNPFVSNWMHQADKKTYILIRNGDNLYRIWTNLEIGDRLFPHKTELMDLQQGASTQREHWYDRGKEAAQKELEQSIEYYRRQFIMMQGLIDRTTVLHPLKAHVKLMDLDLDKTDAVKFIYDDGPSLVPPGYVPFNEWFKRVNSTIEEGTRIILIKDAHSQRGRYDDRYRGNWDKEYSHRLPKGPKKGIYTVFTKKSEKGIRTPWSSWDEHPKEVLCIYYNPGDTIINFWDSYDRGHERKNSVSYIISNEHDRFLINFDEVTTKDIDFYLDSRIDRHEYVWMMPMLWEVRNHKLKEEKEEHDFLLMAIAPLSKQAPQEELLEAAKESMRWWKIKNKWKRGLKTDDAKAFRMISARLKTKFK